jgi:hypothetical protein
MPSRFKAAVGLTRKTETGRRPEAIYCSGFTPRSANIVSLKQKERKWSGGYLSEAQKR